ncbi:MAG TPA: LamG domain-containing protein [Bacteroidota bacterium]|nr:LamG domain-containing protein [Bacteroidota bacterium]
MKLIMIFATIVLVALLASCNKQTENIVTPQGLHAGTVQMSFARAPSGIVQVNARLSRAGYDDKIIQLSVSDTGKVASGSFSNVPVGTWHLKVDALNDTGAVQYSGETDLDVLPGQTTQVSLELLSTTGGIDIVVTWGAICTPAPSGLVSWWTGDGNANDRIGGNDGSTVNGAGFASGKVGRAFNFNGVDQFVRIPGSPSLNPPGSLTIEAWIYPTNDTTANIFAEWGGDYETYNQRAYQLSMFPGGILRFAISDTLHQNDPPFHEFDSPPGVITARAWNHVAGVYDKSTGSRRIYVNAVQVAERIDSPITIYPSTAEITLGAILIPGSSTYFSFFPGKIDEVSFYNRALSEAELRNIYNSGGAGKCR